MALYIARHGQTDWNRQRRYQSTSDVPLNDTGREQARKLGLLLKRRQIQFAHVWSSPLVRATETAEVILSLCSNDPAQVEIKLDPDLVEISLGKFEGKFADDLLTEFGAVFVNWRNSGFIDAAPAGESMREAVDRVQPAVSRARALARDSDVLLVAHQGANMAIKSALEGVLNTDRLNSHRQANDEIDVWDEKSGMIVERLTLAEFN